MYDTPCYHTCDWPPRDTAELNVLLEVSDLCLEPGDRWIEASDLCLEAREGSRDADLKIGYTSIDTYFIL